MTPLALLCPPPFCLSVFPSLCFYVFLSFRLSVPLSFCLSVFLSLYLCLCSSLFILGHLSSFQIVQIFEVMEISQRCYLDWTEQVMKQRDHESRSRVELSL